MIFSMNDLSMFDDESENSEESFFYSTDSFDLDGESHYLVPVSDYDDYDYDLEVEIVDHDSSVTWSNGVYIPDCRYTLLRNVSVSGHDIVGSSDSIFELLEMFWWSHIRSIFADGDWKYGYDVILNHEPTDCWVTMPLEYLMDLTHRLAYALDDEVLLDAVLSKWKMEPIDSSTIWNDDLSHTKSISLMLADLLWLDELPYVERLGIIQRDDDSGVKVITQNQQIDAVLACHEIELDELGLTVEQINGVLKHNSEIWVTPLRSDIASHPETPFIQIR